MSGRTVSGISLITAGVQVVHCHRSLDRSRKLRLAKPGPEWAPEAPLSRGACDVGRSPPPAAALTQPGSLQCPSGRPTSPAGAAMGRGTLPVMTFSRITVRPDQMDGVPCIRGLRIPVATVLGMIADGMSTDDVLDAYPDLEARHASLLRRRNLRPSRRRGSRRRLRRHRPQNAPRSAKGNQALGHPSGTAANIDPTIRQRPSRQTCHNSSRLSKPAASP